LASLYTEIVLIAVTAVINS